MAIPATGSTSAVREIFTLLGVLRLPVHHQVRELCVNFFTVVAFEVILVLRYFYVVLKIFLCVPLELAPVAVEARLLD